MRSYANEKFDVIGVKRNRNRTQTQGKTPKCGSSLSKNALASKVYIYSLYIKNKDWGVIFISIWLSLNYAPTSTSTSPAAMLQMFVDYEMWLWELAKLNPDDNYGDWLNIMGHQDENAEEFNTIINTASSEVGQCRTVYVSACLVVVVLGTLCLSRYGLF